MKIKSIKTTTYNAIEEFDGISKGDVILNIESGLQYFNKEGKLAERISYKQNDYNPEIIYTIIYKNIYNEKGQFIEQIEYQREDDIDFPISKISCEYNDKGLLITQTNYKAIYSSKRIITLENLGDSNFDKNATYSFNYNGEINHFYDDEGECIETKEYNQDFNLKVNRFSQSNDELFPYDVEQKQDDRGNNSELIYYGKDGYQESKSVFEYDSNKNMIACYSYGSDNILQSKSLYKYTHNGNILQQLDYEYEGVPKTESTDYEYDKYNNCISVVTTLNEKPQTITEMKIEYYKSAN